MSKVKITHQGIKKELNKIGMEQAVTEFIWNGFDAQATIVKVYYQGGAGPFDRVTGFFIADNGRGIPAEQLEKKFQPFLESEKAIKLREENIGLEGKNGYGRLTFFKFARQAYWDTCYKK